MNNDCLFCRIVTGEIPAEKVFEDERFIAILDINPVNPGHTLLIPKIHAKNVFDLAEPTLSALGPVVQKLAKAVKKATRADGLNVMMNNERPAGQLVDHQHTHLIPRFADDGFTHWHGKTKPTPEELKETGEQIKLAL